MSSDYIETKAKGTVKPKSGANSRLPYDHQRNAINAMDNLNKKFSAYSTLIVLPTGGGIFSKIFNSALSEIFFAIF